MEPNTQQAETFKPQQQTLFDLQELSVVTTRSMSQLKSDIKTTKQMVKDAYANDATYHTNDEKVKEVRKALMQTKQQIAQLPENASVLQKLKDLTSELKEKEQAVSDYALEYERMSGESEFEKDGEVFQIVKKAKLVKRLQ